jgi:hypothetical protein
VRKLSVANWPRTGTSHYQTRLEVSDECHMGMDFA